MEVCCGFIPRAAGGGGNCWCDLGMVPSAASVPLFQSWLPNLWGSLLKLDTPKEGRSTKMYKSDIAEVY